MAHPTPETLLPYGNGDRKQNQIQSMFDAIAGKYDFLNRFMSLRQDKRWRRKAIQSLLPDAPKNILDVATGTGDFALEAFRTLKPDHVTGVDLSEGMMQIGVQKVKKIGLENRIRFEKQDGTALTYANNTFDAVTVAFGIRNFENMANGITEMLRVLKPGGKAVIVELSRPETFPINQLFNLYASVVLPIAGKLFSKDIKAYHYLPASIRVVPQGKEMTRLMKQSGFERISHVRYSFGVCSMYSGYKPLEKS